MSTAIRPRPARFKLRPPSLDPEPLQRSELRSDDSAKSNVMSLTFGGRQMRCELQRGHQPILAGTWDWKLFLAGSEIDARGRWRTVCSEINTDAGYVEMHLQLDEGVEIERQAFLARRDGFVILADVVKCPQKIAGEYQMLVPLANAIQWRGCQESTEGDVTNGRGRIARAVPLSLPEWRSEGGGRFMVSDRHLQMVLPFHGQRLHAAVFLDLDPRRHRRPLTWRRLTVGESLKVLPRDVAVGYRVQIGKSQWLVYRSLEARSNRTVLGQNYSTEFVVARFRGSGVAEKMLEIE